MLTPEEIFEKEFKRSFHGYNADEVNEFLDLVIQDFARLMEENRTLRRELQSRGGGSSATMSGTMASQQTIVRPQPAPIPRPDEDLIRPSEPARRPQPAPAPTPAPRELPSIRDLIDERPAADDSNRELLRRLEALEKYIYNRDNR